MNICILTTATRDYIKFVPELYQSIERYFLNGHTIHYLLFTDHDTVDVPVDNLRIHKIKHEPWPMMTLKRYHFHLRGREFIQKHDYVFYMDADMLVCDTVGDEILSDLVGACHPGTESFHRKLSLDYCLERFPRSLAYVARSMSPLYYCCGGVQGGTPKHYLKMAEVLAKAIDDDLAREVIALWHDESHFNKYLLDHPPSLILPIGFVSAPRYDKTLSPHIAKIMMLFSRFALWLYKRQTLPAKTMTDLSRRIVGFLYHRFCTNAKPKIMALDKDHAAFRAEVTSPQ